MSYDISVIVPVYNAEQYLSECIDSILKQTKQNIEIILVNDGSTDTSGEIIAGYVNAYPNIVLVNQENSGVAAARIAGLQRATGKYIGWVDADDFIKPQMFEKLYQLAIENDADLSYCSLEFYPKKSQFKEIWFKDFTGKRDWNFIERNSQCWHFLASSKLLAEIDVAASFREFDEYAWISPMLNARKIVSTSECLYCYRVGHLSASGGSYKGKTQKFIRGADMSSRLKKLLKGTPYEQELDSYFDYRYIYSLLLLEIVAAINSDKEAYFSANKKLKALNFRKNPYTKLILDHNHGKLKSFVLRYVIPSSFVFATAITNLILQ